MSNHAKSKDHGRNERARRTLGRRRFLGGALAGVGGLTLGAGFAAQGEQRPAEYRGPNVIIVRFGGGTRRRESIDPAHTYSPYLLHELVPRGTLFPRMEIASIEGMDVSHGPGTLNILTGKYDRYRDVGGKFLGERFEAGVPTVFEYLRKSFAIPEHQTLIVNGEDRIDEEFYTFSNHHLFGVDYRSNVLSLFRYKTHLLGLQLAEGKWHGAERRKQEAELAKMRSLDHRVAEPGAQSIQMQSFWDGWRRYYGETGLVNPRGDRVLTELAIRALGELHPKLMMINYNDCDYVHWGNLTHYTRAIQVMDEGIRRIVEATQANEEYRDNTIFVIVPDCGRDNNPLRSVPCQHHFNSRSAREIFALFVGPGVMKGARVDKRVEQVNVAATIGAFMGFKAEHAEAGTLEEAFA